MTSPLVAISQRRDPTGPPHNEIRDALDHRLAAFVIAAGGLPLPVPSALAGDTLAAWLATLNPGAILLSGGPDIDVDPQRDAVDKGLMAYARNADLPLLGLCRGMQMMADAAGTSLCAVTDHIATRHMLTGEITRAVNSYHAQALADVPMHYHMLAHAPDGTIEAIGHDTLTWEGWMWHPERETQFDLDDVARFKRIIT